MSEVPDFQEENTRGWQVTQEDNFAEIPTSFKEESDSPEYVIVLEGVRKQYPNTEEAILENIDLEVIKGRKIALVGPSGSGKTTLLFIIAGLLRPTSGNIYIFNKDLNAANQEELAEFRGMNVGFVFQHYHLISTLTVMENVVLPADLLGVKKREQVNERAYDLLEDLKIRHRADALPSQLSGGELQRAAFARALINDPPLVLCDEPTANLDRTTAILIAEKIDQEIELGRTLVVATHDSSLIKGADVRFVRSGRLERDESKL